MMPATSQAAPAAGDQTRRPVVLDFGLHEGEDTEFYLACGADVIAFEANEALVRRNSARFAPDVETGRLRIVAGAIVPPNFAGTEITFYLDDSKSVWGTTSPDWARRNSGLGSSMTSVTVPAVDLTAVLRDVSDILYAKIDIEGADAYVLDTFRSARVQPSFISIESDKLDLNEVIAEIGTLEDLGYTRFAAVQQATVPGYRLRGVALDGAPLDYRFREHSSGPFGPYLKQEYKTAGEVIDDYRAIFCAYARFGDRSLLMRYGPSRFATRAVNSLLVRALNRPLCGWYDTHAAL
jgi:FkbM family methyltransferase